MEELPRMRTWRLTKVCVFLSFIHDTWSFLYSENSHMSWNVALWIKGFPCLFHWIASPMWIIWYFPNGFLLVKTCCFPSCYTQCSVHTKALSVNSLLPMKVRAEVEDLPMYIVSQQLRLEHWLKALSHRWLLYDFSAVWIHSCLKDELLLEHLHTDYRQRVFPVWILWYEQKLALRLRCFPYLLQLLGFSLVNVELWVSISPFSFIELLSSMKSLLLRWEAVKGFLTPTHSSVHFSTYEFYADHSGMMSS